ncbi:MAG: penicillin acylase family protein [Sinobacteraceae bacterium]|nr:penicillin acylase family protein [Nevskiaceae bacterium]
MKFRNFRADVVAAAAAALWLAACTGSSPASAPPGGEGGGGGSPGDGTSVYLNVLPPGSNGNSAGGLGAPVPGVPVLKYPPNFEDQLALYGDLSYAQPKLKDAPCTPPTDASQHATASDLACNYFKHEGLTPDTVASTETLTAPSGNKVTITRDDWGVPFIDAPTRSDAMYGVGYANAEDRLWLDDLLRHLGRGMITQYLGVAPGVTEFDANLAAVAGYSEDELTQMTQDAAAQLGSLGPVFLDDASQFVAGVNAYIATLSGANLAKIPPEYATLKPLGFPPAPFTVNDIVASAILIQSIFATGGGGEVTNELLLQTLDPNLAPGASSVAADACRFWRDLRHADDPQTPVTIDTRFATQSPAALDETCPHALPAGAAIWDRGSYAPFVSFTYGNLGGLPLSVPAQGQPQLKDLKGIAAPGGPQARSAQPPKLAAASKMHPVRVALNPIQGARAGLARAGMPVPDTLSNWIGVTAAHTATGHPIAVMGPQTSYFVPQLLWEFAVRSHGGTTLDFDGRGIDFAMLPYIEIGRGIDYAWSATSGESDLIDTRVSKMCNTDGSQPTGAIVNGFPDADGYLYDAHDGKGPVCRKFYERADTWTALPTPASLALGGPALPQTVKRYVLRTHYGPVMGIAKVAGAPVVISQQRATFYNELGTAAPFALASTTLIHDPKSFQQVFNGVTGSFNWLYIDRDHLAYLHSGLYPQRDPQQDPDLPVWGDGDYEWANDARALNGTSATMPGFFSQYGGNTPYPSRVVILPQGDPRKTGYYEFQDFLPLSAHPQTVDPARGFLDSWNNKPAPGWWAADSNGSYGPTHRVAMLADRLKAFMDSGAKFNFANMVEVMADAAYTDLRGQDVLPLLLQIMQQGPLTADQQQVVTLMQQWLDGESSEAWIGPTAKGLGAWRRDRDDDGVYDFRHQAVLMDAWYPHLIDTLLPQMTAVQSALGSDSFLLQGRYDAPRAQGSAYQNGWFEQMKRVLEMALGTPNHTDYRALKCAGTGTLEDCRHAVLAALDAALTDLGGLSNLDHWDGTQLANPADGKTGETVETYDEVKHTDFSLLPVPPIRWLNRPTFQQVIEIHNRR